MSGRWGVGYLCMWCVGSLYGGVLSVSGRKRVLKRPYYGRHWIE
jgi:hypothetical protein